MISVGSLSFLQPRPNDATRGCNNINFNTRRALIAQSFSLAGRACLGWHIFKRVLIIRCLQRLPRLSTTYILRLRLCECERSVKKIAPKPNSRIYIKLSLSISNVWRYRSVTGGNRREWIAPLGVPRHKFRRFCSIYITEWRTVVPLSGRGYFPLGIEWINSWRRYFLRRNGKMKSLINQSLAEFSVIKCKRDVFKHSKRISKSNCHWNIQIAKRCQRYH